MLAVVPLRAAFVAGLALALFVLVVLVLIAVGEALVAHVERCQKVMNHLGEAALVFDLAGQAIEIAVRAVLDVIAPQRHDLLGGRRRLLAGQSLAHQHGDRVFHGRIGALGDFLIIAAMEAILEHGRQIGGDAHHPPRADRLDARLLDRFEHGPRRIGFREHAPVDRGVVAGKPQCHRVGVPAQDRRVVLGHAPRRLREPRTLGG